MSEMIERVARAIYERPYSPGYRKIDQGSAKCDFADAHPTVRARLLADARAAIEAMRGKYDLPLAMKSAGVRVLQEKAPDGGEPLATAHRCWKAMIDEALK